MQHCKNEQNIKYETSVFKKTVFKIFESKENIQQFLNSVTFFKFRSVQENMEVDKTFSIQQQFGFYFHYSDTLTETLTEITLQNID